MSGDHDQGILGHLRAAPDDETARLIAADWYADRGDLLHEAQCRTAPPPPAGVPLPADNGDGYEFIANDVRCENPAEPYFITSVTRIPTGNGTSPYGGGNYSYGNPTARGHGHGSYYGRGAGAGYGRGWSVVFLPPWERVMPEVGFNQLIILPHGWVIAAFVSEQIGPYQFRVERVVVICETGGVPWDELADGGRRELGVYRNWGVCTIGPQFVISRRWAGELPVAS